MCEGNGSVRTDETELIADIPAIGSRIGPYVLVSELGYGGMGHVYLAEDTRLRGKVAIKLVEVREPDTVGRFLKEARVTARCIHPNIVIIHDISAHGAMPFMVLEYVEGQSLAQLRSADTSPDQIVQI